MTDTPRTKAELLALFANNTAHDISPQDLRDFVVSTSVTQPYENYGFGAGWTVSQVVTDGTTAMVDLSQAQAGDEFSWQDPQSWADPSPYVSDWFGATSAAYSVLRLPPGIYAWNTYMSLGASPEPDSRVWCAWDYADTNDASNPSDPLDISMGNGIYQFGFNGPRLKTSAKISDKLAEAQGLFRIPNARVSGAPVTSVRVAPYLTVGGVASSVTLTYFAMWLQRVT